MKRRISQAPFVQKFRNVYIVLSNDIITIHTETKIGIFVEERWGGGGTSSFSLYTEAPLERGTFSRFQVYERVGKSVISVCKDPKGQVTK